MSPTRDRRGGVGHEQRDDPDWPPVMTGANRRYVIPFRSPARDRRVEPVVEMLEA